MLNLFSRKPPLPVIDRSYGCPEAKTVNRNFAAGKFRLVSRELAGQKDADQICFFIDLLVDVEDRPPRFEQWIDAEPRCPFARLASGAHALEWAWQARGFTHAEEVTDSQWDESHSRLGFARTELEKAIELGADISASLGYLLRYALGMNWSPLDANSLYLEATNDHPPTTDRHPMSHPMADRHHGWRHSTISHSSVRNGMVRMN